jgi:hypothetical protein
MTIVLLDGRRLPHQDFEGDDATPGADGRWVTCTDTSAGRALCYSTNGRINLDGKQIRAAVHPHDTDGIRLEQAKQAIEALTNTTIIIPTHWGWADVLAHLRQKRGLIVQGWYAEIPRAERFQLRADFGHAVWISHDSRTSGCRVWDALDANTKHHGNWIARGSIRAFAEEFARRQGRGPDRLYVGYVPLQHL